MINDRWSLQKIPPRGHKDVPEFAYNLFDIAAAEKERLRKNDDFLANYSLYRGKSLVGTKQLKSSTPVNLYFSNVERTVANITARNPTGEVVDLDGYEDGAEKILSVKLKKWWKDTAQQQKTRISARAMEIYGVTPEKPVWDKVQHQPDILTTDPFAFFPAPGNWENISEEAPYICFAYLDFVDKVESEFGVTGVLQDSAYELLGAVREEYKTTIQPKTGNYADALIPTRNKADVSDKKIERCLIIEVWVRDNSTRTEKEENPVLDERGYPQVDENGQELFEQITRKVSVYPDGVRKITITQAKGDSKTKEKSGYMVLDDSANPNINPNLEIELASTTHPWGRLPVYVANSYKDLVTIWGFAAAEQVGDLITKINQIVSKLINYVINVMAPPLVVQQHCGITRAMIEESLTKAGRLVLMPTIPNARIEFMQIPNLPATFFQVLDLITRYFDRVYTIEDADRGQAPKGVIAASAIVALQERNQVLMQAKTSAIDYLAEQRSKWCIGLMQNFGTRTEMVNVADNMIPFRGVNYAGRKFSYVIEAGSSTPRTSLQIQEMAVNLYEVKAIDQRALLENLNFPGWQEIIERTAESQLDQALLLLVEAGLPEEEAMKLKQYLMQPEQGIGGEKVEGKSTEAKTAKTGTPKAQQGVI